MDWFIWAVISLIGSAISNIARKVLMKNDKNDPIATSILFQLFGAIIIGVFAFAHGFVLPPIANYPLNYLLAACVWGLATLCLFKSYQYIEASEATILTTFESVVTIAASMIFLKNSFTTFNLIGTILIISSIVLIYGESKKMKFNQGVFYALGYALFAGIGVTNDAFLLKTSSTLPFLTIDFLLPGIFLAIVRPQAFKKMGGLFRKNVFFKFFILIFCYSLAAIAFFFSLESGAQPSQLGPLTQASVIVTVILAAVFLGEKDNLLRKIVSAILVILGVIFLK